MANYVNELAISNLVKIGEFYELATKKSRSRAY